MIKIVNGPQDLKGFDQDQLYRVYEMKVEQPGELIALATTIGEALDAKEMLGDLTGFKRTYHITPPRTLAN